MVTEFVRRSWMVPWWILVQYSLSYLRILFVSRGIDFRGAVRHFVMQYTKEKVLNGEKRQQRQSTGESSGGLGLGTTTFSLLLASLPFVSRVEESAERCADGTVGGSDAGVKVGSEVLISTLAFLNFLSRAQNPTNQPTYTSSSSHRAEEAAISLNDHRQQESTALQLLPSRVNFERSVHTNTRVYIRA